MDQADFDYDSDLFKFELGQFNRSIASAKERLQSLANHWDEMGVEFLGGLIRISANPNSDRIDGNVCGKAFSIHYSPVRELDSSLIEAALTIEDLVSKKPIVISRFLVSTSGVLLSLDGKALCKDPDSDYNYRALVAIARRVIFASSNRD